MKNILKAAAFAAILAGLVSCEKKEITDYTIETVNSGDVVKEYATGKVIVKYDLNGAVGVIPAPHYVKAGETVTLAAPVKGEFKDDETGKKVTLTSKGWSLTPEGDVITSYKADQGAVLYAVWTDDKQ
ncbi:MAG: hypothetical protein IIU11_07370 [Bacteroidales bacterium]|nr:hypothetical protein [Bacteroidales bacterium]